MKLEYSFAIWLFLALHLTFIWGLFWVMRQLIAPLIRDVVKGIKI